MHNVSRRIGEKKKREVIGRFIQRIIKRTTYERPRAVDRRATAQWPRELEGGSESTSPGLGGAPTAKPTSTYSLVVLTEHTDIDASGS